MYAGGKMTPDEEQRQQEKEYESVSEQSDQILVSMQELMSENRMDDAIAVGDEFFEWIRQDPDEVFLYYNEKELQRDYESKKQ